MEWVLIIMLTAWSGNPAASVTTVEFRTQHACQVAAEALREPTYYQLTLTCAALDDQYVVSK